ncbi:unnamed protein product, partial [Polarella glacialis]
MAAPATPQETAVFLQLGAAITALTGKIETMTATNWTLGPYDATWGAQPATNADVVMIVQKSITEIIAPAVMSLTDKLANRCNLITEEIRAMAIRMAWMETDVLKFQQDLARTQLVIRNWPDRNAFQTSLKDGKFAKFYKMKEKAQEDLTAAQPGTGLAHLSKLLKKSRPAFDHATALTANIQDWQLRYKFEFPWAVTFTAVSPASSHRAMTQNLRSAKDLMSEMATQDANMFELDPQDVRTPDEVHRDNLTAEEIKSIEQSGWTWRTEKGI